MKKYILFAMFISAFVALVGCGNESFNWFSDIDKRPETIQVFYIGGVPHLDKDGDGEFETPTTQMEVDILAANGTHIQIMNAGGIVP